MKMKSVLVFQMKKDRVLVFHLLSWKKSFREEYYPTIYSTIFIRKCRRRVTIFFHILWKLRELQF